jgi:myo-inositol 2-dehydrogenase/D-chiro-inositol 1-dehydrogenase
MIELGFAVLGCGRIGRMHADMLHSRVAGARVAAVYDVVPAAARSVADATGALVAGSLEEAVGADGGDAVAICTTTDTHVEAIVAAAPADVAIFCEKPVSLDLAEVDRGLAAVDASGVPLQIGFNRRFDPSHKAVADAVAHGAIGDVHLCNITSRDPGPPPIDYIGTSGGIFCDMTIHDFDMARYVTGSEVVDVFAKGAVRVDPAIGEAGDLDTAVVVMTHENGAITTIDNSRKATYGYDQRVEAFGSGGKAASDNFHEFNSLVATDDGFRRPPLEHFFLERYVRSYLDQWAAFVEMVTSGGPSPVGGADGRAPLVMGLAAWASVREHRLVRTEEIG